MWYKLQWIYVWNQKVRPKITYLVDITDYQSMTTYTWLANWAGAFNTDWTKYFCWVNTSQVGQYSLGTAYNLDAWWSPTTLNVGWEIHQVYVSPDGTHLACASYSDTLYIWDMTTPRDITTATNPKTMTVSSIVWVRFKPDWTRVYAHSFGDWVYQYDLSTPRDVTTATSAGSNSTWNDTRWVCLSNDWSIMIWNAWWTTYQVNLTTPRDVSSTVSWTQKSASLNALQTALTHDNSRLICASRWIVEFKTN